MSFSFIALDYILINFVGPSHFSVLSALLLILQLTSSGGIIADELSQPFYKVGKALPFYYGAKGFRRIFFGAGRSDMWCRFIPCCYNECVLNTLSASADVAMHSQCLYTYSTMAQRFCACFHVLLLHGSIPCIPCIQ